ncbi:hypothetical protein Tco_1257907, partial [Tanacetum coccineum]
MAEEQTIVYAPQWNNMTVDNNYLREFWSTSIAYDPFPSTDETEQRPLREFLMKFIVLNEQRPLTLDFNTFCSSTDLNYNNGKYVAHPTPKDVKKELGKIAINLILSGNYSSTEQVNSIQQLLACCLIAGTQVDIGEIIYNDLVTKLLNKSRLKYVSYPRFISCALQVLLDPSKVTDIELTAYMIAVNNQRDSVSPLPLSAKPKKGKSHTVTLTLPKSQGPEASGALSKKSIKPKSKKTPAETKATSTPKPTKGSEQSHPVSLGTVPDPQDLERNIQLASTGLPSTLDEGTRKSQPLPESTTIDPKDSVGNKPIDTGLTSMAFDEGTAKTTSHPKGNQQEINEATESFTKISTNIAEVLSLVKGFNFADLRSSVNALQAHALKQDKELAAWAKSSTNMAWNLGSRLSGQSLGSVTPTLALTHISANVEGENATNTATEDPPSYTERETDANRQDKSEEPKHSTDVNIEFIGKGISTDEQVEDQRKLVKASSIIHPDPDAFIPYTIDGEVYYLTTEQLHAHMDKEEKIKKTEEESKLFTISKPEMIKVVQQEAKKLGIHLKEAITTKAGENFKKARDAEHEFLKRQHTKKVRKSLELKKHKYDNYMWTISSRLKPETITDVKILPKTKPVVITVFRGT